MSNLGLSQDGISGFTEPSANPNAFKATGLIAPLVVVGVVLLACISACMYRKREGIRRALHLKKAADEATSPLEKVCTPPIKVELPKAKDYARGVVDKDGKRRDPAKETKKDDKPLILTMPEQPKKSFSRREKLALLEEGLFGKRSEEAVPSAKDALKEMTNVATAAASPSTLPRSSPPSSPLGVSKQPQAKVSPINVPPKQDFESTTPPGSPPPAAHVPRIVLRKATTQQPEHLPLPDSPETVSPPCPVAAGMIHPPLPPMPGSFGDE